MHVIKKSNVLSRVFFLLLLTGITQHSYPQINTASGETLSYKVFDQLVKQQMDSLQIPGASIAVINKGEIVYEKSYGYANIDSQIRVQQNTIFEAASMSKPVFAYFVLKMMQDGVLHLDLDQPVYEYFPYPDIAYDDRYKLITAKMLLTHTSGFPNWRENNKLTIKFTPGTQYSYSGEGYEYLVNAVATKTHTNSQSLDSLLGMEVCLPLGLEHFGYIRTPWFTSHKAYGYFTSNSQTKGEFRPVPVWFGASYTLHTDAHNYGKFLVGLLKNKGLNKSNTDSLLKPRVQITDEGKPNGQSYAYGFVVDSTPYGTRYQHTGNNGSFTGGFMFSRDKELGYVVFTNGDKGVLLDLRLADAMTYGIKK